MYKTAKIISIIFLFTLLTTPHVVLATKTIGDACSSDTNCAPLDCEDSGLDTSNDDFCVCRTAIDCSAKYGGDSGQWKCIDDDDDVFYDLHYCVRLSDNKAQNPLEGNTDPKVQEAIKKYGSPGVLDAITDAEGSVQVFHNEISQIMKTPQPKITIPGLNFSEIDVEQMITKDARGDTWLNIPFLGEYLSIVYRYSVIAISVLAIIAIIDAGIVWTMRGSNPEGRQSAQKKLVLAFTGLIIASISYALLYTINPDLVNFRSLKVLYVKEEGIIHDLSEDSETYDDIKPPPCRGPNNPSIFAGFGVDKTGPMDTYACGTRSMDKIRFLVIHEGASGDTAAVLMKRHLSTHYIIQRDGSVHQTAGLEKRARHAGAINAESVGVDLQVASNCSAKYACTKDPSCLANCVYTPAQYESLSKLIDFLSARTSISRSDARIIGHCQVSGTTHGDPRNLDWKLLGFDPCKHRKDCGKSGAKACIKAWGKGNAYVGEVVDDSSNPVGCCVIDEEGVAMRTPQKRKDCEAMSNFVDFESVSCPLGTAEDVESSDATPSLPTFCAS